LYYPPSPQTGNAPFILTRDRDVIMVVKNPERWFGQLYTRSDKPDPRTKVSTEAADYEKIKKLREDAANLPDNSAKKTASIAQATAQEEYWRDFVSTQLFKRWLEQSCFLVVDGHRFIDLHPIVDGGFPAAPQFSADSTTYDNFWYLRFHPAITTANKPDWMSLLSGQGFTPREVTVTLGQSNSGDLTTTDDIATDLRESKGHPVWLQVAVPLELVAGSLVVVVLLVTVLLLVTRTTILQEFDPDTELWHTSLGRSQMAFWFLLILISYVFLWIVTGDYCTLTESELVLFGISAATGLGAVIMSESDKNVSRKLNPLTEADLKITEDSEFASLITAAEQELVSQQAKVNAETDPAKKVELNEDLEWFKGREAALKTRREYFQRSRFRRLVSDLLEETDSPSLHRLQMIAWTVVLGLVFLNSVYFALVMPKFDATLLALMGISSGTYLGFKFQSSSGKTANS
jgi:hypothetical protein